MPKVTFMNELVTVEAPAGRTLLDVAEEHGINVFRGLWPELHCGGDGQRSAWCNRCKVWVNGLAPGALGPRTKKEQRKLYVNGALPAQGTMRLACQVVIQGDCEVRTRAGGVERKPNPEWAPDPRPWKWRERWEKRNEQGGDEEGEEGAPKKPAPKPAAKQAVAAASGGGAATPSAPAKPEA